MYRALPIALLIACSGSALEEDGLGLLADPTYGIMNPFPSSDLVVDGHLSVPEEGIVESDTDLPVERIEWRTGFSPVQPIVLELPGVQAGAFPTWQAPTPGEGAVQLWDLDAGEALPVMAELDKHPEATGSTVLIRPLMPMADGHTVAVVLTNQAADRPERFGKLIEGGSYATLMEELGDLGVDTESVALAWSFPVADGRKPLHSALSQLTLPEGLTIDTIKNVDDGDRVPRATYRQVAGSFPVMNVVGDDNLLFLEADGSVTPDGTDEAKLFIHIPESVADAAAGTVPIMVVGHGMFGTPDQMFSGVDELGPFVELAEELGVIVVGTRWRGLDYSDAVVAIAASNDFGRFPQVPELMVQGQVNTRTLIERVVDGSLFDDAVFQGRSGQSLPDPSQVVYHGTSMGGVLGGVMLGNDPPIDTAVLRVPGGVWSALLERSNQWELFEQGLVPHIPDPVQRQQMYAASQLFWDPVDPVNYGDVLPSKDILIQESVGDDVVANMGTRVLARVMGAQLMEPSAESVYGIESGGTAAGPGVRAYVQYTTSTEPPPEENRPAPTTNAHTRGYGWDGLTAQAVHFLHPDTAGEVVHFCGDEPCSPTNPGAYPE